MDAMNLWGLFDGTGDAMSEANHGREADVAGAFTNDVRNTDWQTLAVGAGYGTINLGTGGWYGEVVTRDHFANTYGASSRGAEWRAGQFLGAMAAGTALTFTGAGMIVPGLAMYSHGAYQATQVTDGDYLDSTLEMLGGGAMAAAGIAGLSLRGSIGLSECFVAGTQVAARGQDGEVYGKNIEQIEVGDWVWSRDEATGQEGFKPVVTLFVNTTDTLVHLTYTSGSVGSETTLSGTPGHPFWSLTRDTWVTMGNLRLGEKLALAGGLTATASSVRIERLASLVTVYNFEVADWHTYHVGTADTGWVWVHNQCACGSVARLKQIQAENRALGLVQDHHLIPHSGTANFQGHGLVQAANVNLRTYGRNIQALGNHSGGHTVAYRQGGEENSRRAGAVVLGRRQQECATLFE